MSRGHPRLLETSIGHGTNIRELARDMSVSAGAPGSDALLDSRIQDDQDFRLGLRIPKLNFKPFMNSETQV